MNLGELKDYTLSVREDFFNKEYVNMPIVVAIEDYYGNTIQVFYMNMEENMAKIAKVLDDEISTDVEDYGLRIDSLGVIKYLNEVLEVADRDIDEFFDTNCDMLRLQMKQPVFKRGLYEVVLSQTETKAGKIYVYADSKEEAEEIVDEEKDYYFEALEDTKEASCMHYEIEVHSVEEIDKNNSPSNVTFLDENEDLYKKEYMSNLEIEEMCSLVDSMKEKLRNVLKYRSVDNNLLSTLLIDIMDLSSDIKCELDEDDESSRVNIENKIKVIQFKIEEFLKNTL